MTTKILHGIAHVPYLFTYDTEVGEVYVYVLEASPVDIFGVVTFYERGSEPGQEVYAATSLRWTSTSALIREAENRYVDSYGSEGENPFTTLLADKKSLERLDKMFDEAKRPAIT
jgi:hypothetical protein